MSFAGQPVQVNKIASQAKTAMPVTAKPTKVNAQWMSPIATKFHHARQILTVTANAIATMLSAQMHVPRILTAMTAVISSPVAAKL